MKVIVLICLLLCTASTGKLLKDTKSVLENVQVVVDRIASKKLIEDTLKIAEIIEISKAVSKDKIKKITKFVEKVLNSDKLQKAVKIAGPAGDALLFALSLFSEEAEDRFDTYFKNISDKLDVVDTKLNEISEKVITTKEQNLKS